MKNSNEETHPLFYLSCLCVNLYFLSPLLSFIKFYRMKEERNDEWKFLPGIQIFAVLINCMFWVVSGESSDDDNMSIVNVIGLIIALFFVFIYWTSAFNGKFKEYFIYLFNVCNILFQLGWGSYYLMKKFYKGKENEASLQFGHYCAMVFNILMYAAVFQNLYFIRKTKDYTKLPIIEALIGMVSTVCWIAYSYIQKNANEIALQILIPNSVSLVILIAFVICYCVLRFCRKDLKIPDEALINE